MTTRTPSGARYPVVECDVPVDEVELASADLYDLATVGIEELAHDGAGPGGAGGAGLVRLRAGFPSDELARAAQAALNPRWKPRHEVIVGDDWLDAWREHFAPFRVGKLVVVPAWKDEAELFGDPVLAGMGLGDVVMHLDPGRSFGTGAHASTALALELLQVVARADADARGADALDMLDVGCGSGVVSVAALLFGARHAHGIDIETAAVEATLDNAHRNAVADRCTAGATPIRDVLHTYDLVVANILAPVLIELAASIARAVVLGGHLILSGLIDEQRDRVVAAYPELTVVDERRQEPWVALLLARRDPENR